MKLKSTFTVELESPDCKAILTFRKPPMNEILQSQLDLEGITNPLQRIGEGYKSILKHLVAVEGLEDEDGAVTAEKLKGLGLPFDTMVAIVSAYNAATTLKEADPEKKAS